jgi:hypothetical protein
LSRFRLHGHVVVVSFLLWFNALIDGV